MIAEPWDVGTLLKTVCTKFHALVRAINRYLLGDVLSLPLLFFFFHVAFSTSVLFLDETFLGETRLPGKTLVLSCSSCKLSSPIYRSRSSPGGVHGMKNFRLKSQSEREKRQREREREREE